ncbi:MAG: cytidine deaminase [Paludibacteraceae bacterium]|nr:cytidine deaminase [Paludibacteraceae bacterium]
MKEITLSTKATLYQENELPAEYQQLVQEAKHQTNHSYSPYSHFQVGAAALLEDGTIVKGSNQENAAYPSGLCAERTTLFYANSTYPHLAVKAIAIACYTDGAFTPQPGSPCGACRQVMIEFEHLHKQKMAVILYGAEHSVVFESAADLLPMCFFAESLHGGSELI